MKNPQNMQPLNVSNTSTQATYGLYEKLIESESGKALWYLEDCMCDPEEQFTNNDPKVG